MKYQENLSALEESDLNRALSELVEKKVAESDELAPVFFLEGGHFDPRDGAEEFSINSLDFALAFGQNLIRKYKKRLRLVLGTLIDDLGLDCGSADACEFRPQGPMSAPQLPNELNEMLEASRIYKKDKFLITTERNAKNRGANTVKKLVKEGGNSLVIEDDQLFFTEEGTEKKILMAKRNALSWTVICPTIMAQHYTDVFEKIRDRFAPGSSVTVIDFSDLYDQDKVNAGSKVCTNLFLRSNKKLKTAGNLEIINVCSDPELDMYEVKNFKYVNI